MNQTVAFGIFSVGIIICILGGAKVPAAGTDWPDTLGLFSVGAVISIVGLFLWRKVVAIANAEETKSQDSKDPATILQEMAEPLDRLSSEIGEMDADTITKRIDEILDTYVLPFAEVRQRIINKLGMEKGAEILVVVAYGERMLNRVWSAAADGHTVEASSCFPEAHEAFAEAQKLLQSPS